MNDVTKNKNKKKQTKEQQKKHWQTLTNLPGSGAESESGTVLNSCLSPFHCCMASSIPTTGIPELSI